MRLATMVVWECDRCRVQISNPVGFDEDDNERADLPPRWARATITTQGPDAPVRLTRHADLCPECAEMTITQTGAK